MWKIEILKRGDFKNPYVSRSLVPVIEIDELPYIAGNMCENYI